MGINNLMTDNKKAAPVGQLVTASKSFNECHYRLCSGFGKYHTDSQTSPKPRPFATCSFAEIVEIAINPPEVSKSNAQWIIPSTLLSRNRAKQFTEGQFYLLVADIDEEPPRLRELMTVISLAIGGALALGYTSKSAKSDYQKAHVLIPVPAMNGYRWSLCQTVLCNKLEVAGITPDRKVLEPNQVCYLPNRGEYYDCHMVGDGVFNSVNSWFKELDAEHVRREQLKHAALIAKQERLLSHPPMAKQGGLIDAFNAAVAIEDLLIQAGYEQNGSNFRHPNSKTGNYSASVKNGRVFTLSSSDPLFSDHAHDAFSVFVTLFHAGDTRKALIDAGDNWLFDERGISHNMANRIKYHMEGCV